MSRWHKGTCCVCSDRTEVYLVHTTCDDFEVCSYDCEQELEHALAKCGEGKKDGPKST